jgi:hypothetical protein
MPPQCSCVVIESSFDPGERLQAPGSLWFSYADPKSKMAATTGHRLTLDPVGKCSNMNIMRYGVNVNETTTPKSNCIIAHLDQSCFQ